MSLVLTIDGVDKSSIVEWKTLRKRDRVNEKTDTLSFTIKKYGDRTYRPEVNKEVILTHNGTKVFGGVTVVVNVRTERKIVYYEVECKDYSQYLNRKLVTERYEDQTVAYIINDLLNLYASDFTDNNVVGTLTIKSVAFNRITVGEAIKKLAAITNYSWYVDYDKDIHFFPKAEEVAPFALSDSSGNYVFDSLQIQEDISQIKNSILVEGGDVTSDSTRTKTHDGDGSKDIFDTVYKFSGKPTVTVDSVVQTVGTEYIDDDADYDCMWSYNEKYVRFTDGNIPAAGTDNVELEGYPKFPILVAVPAPSSISVYGTYEHTIKDKTIRTTDEAIERAKAEIQAYGEQLKEGSFRTYEDGLRSGQVMTINSTVRDISTQVMIQSVNFKTRDSNGDSIEYDVQFATLRSLGIIDYLLSRLDDEELTEGESETLLTYLQETGQIEVTDTIGTPTTSTGPYVYSNDAGTTPNAATYSRSTYGS